MNASVAISRSPCPVLQIGFVVEDSVRSSVNYARLFDLGPWVFSNDTAEETILRGRKLEEPTGWFSGNVANFANIQLELIDPLWGPGSHIDFLRSRGQGVHHISVGLFDRTKLPGPPVLLKMTYNPGVVRIGEPIALNTKNRSFSITANVVVPADRCEGVIASIGGMQSGWSLYSEAGRLNFVYNFFGNRSVVRGPIVAPGPHALRWEFAYDGGGMGKGDTGTLLVDGQPVGTGRVERTVPLAFTADETFDVGIDLGTPVAPYISPFGYNGTIVTVTLDTSPDALRH